MMLIRTLSTRVDHFSRAHVDHFWRALKVVRLVVVDEARPRPVPGRMKGRLVMAPDFDEPLEDFAEYR